MFEQREYRVIVDAALHDGINLDWRQAGALRGADAGQHFFRIAQIASHACEYRWVEAVEADGDALQARGPQFCGMLW